MKYQINCPGCNAGYQVDESRLGGQVKCAKCQMVFATEKPAPAQPAPAAPVQPATPIQPTPAAPAQAGMPGLGQQPAGNQPLGQLPSQPGGVQSGSDLFAGFGADVAPLDVSAQGGAGQQGDVPAGYTRCPDCYENVPTSELAFHRQQHLGKADDGQYNHYPTLPPEKRFQGPLTGVPQNYRHTECGVVTTMPEPIIRTYLVNPFFYGYSSFCCGCNKHVSAKQLVWTETNQRMMDYYRDLQRPFSTFCKERMGVIDTLLISAAVCAFIIALIVFLVAKFAFAAASSLMIGGVTFLALTLVFTILFFVMRGGL